MARKQLLEMAKAISIMFAVVAAVALYAGTWPPAVIVKSGSMMHADEHVSYGRLGTIDPGDVILVKATRGVDEVQTLAEGGGATYGASGDVLVFAPGGDLGAVPIIHRAIAYVEVVPSAQGDGYRLRWPPARACEGGGVKDPADPRWCVYGPGGVRAPTIGIVPLGGAEGLKPDHSGFLTKGDNPVTNAHLDQVSGIAPPVRPEWVMGVARGELPWWGLVKLALAEDVNQPFAPKSWPTVGNASAPRDLWVMLTASLAILFAATLAWDAATKRRRRSSRSSP